MAGRGQVRATTGLVWNGVVAKPKDKSGDWGLAARWRPEWLDGTMGLYYREYTSKKPHFIVDTATATAGLNAAYDYREKLYGISLAKQMFGISFGTDVTYRPDATLNTMPFTEATGPASSWAPRGDLYTGTFNMIALDAKRAIGDFTVWDSAALTAEISYAGLRKFTRNAQNANSKRNCLNGGTTPTTAAFVIAALNGTTYGCFTGESYGLSFLFEPKWFQVWSGVDVTMPIFFSEGLKGNSPATFGDNEHQGSYSIGLTADVNAKYNFALKFNAPIYKAVGNKSNAVLGDNRNQAWLSFTAKATW